MSFVHKYGYSSLHLNSDVRIFQVVEVIEVVDVIDVDDVVNYVVYYALLAFRSLWPLLVRPPAIPPASYIRPWRSG